MTEMDEMQVIVQDELMAKIRILQDKKSALEKRCMMLEKDIQEFGRQIELLAKGGNNVKCNSFTNGRIEDVLALDKKLCNVLTKGGVTSMSQLLSYKASELLKIHNLGEKYLNEIVLALTEQGLRLIDEDTNRERQMIEKTLLPCRMKTTEIEALNLPKEIYDALCINDVCDAGKVYWHNYIGKLVKEVGIENISVIQERMESCGFPFDRNKAWFSHTAARKFFR